jgi:hypothetical protein
MNGAFHRGESVAKEVNGPHAQAYDIERLQAATR